MSVTNSSWSILYDALIEAGLNIQTGANCQFQFMAQPVVAAWGTGTDQTYWADLWGNYPSSEMGPLFDRAVGNISDAYYDFINSLEYSHPQTDPKYQNLIAQQKSLSAQLSTAESDSIGAYLAWKQSTSASIFPEFKTYSDWLAIPAGGEIYQTRIAQFRDELNQINLQLIPFQKGSDKAISLAISNADPSNMILASIPNSGGLTKKVYSQTLSPDLASQLSLWQSGQKSNSVTLICNANSKARGQWHIEGEGEALLTLGFFGFGGEGSYSYDKRIEQDAHYVLEVDIQAAQMFSITRGNWFNGALITQYPQGPWAGKTAEQYYGRQGSLKLIPSQILVIYGASFKLTLSHSMMETVHTAYQSKAGIMIGPFFFGHKSSGDATVTQNTDGSSTMSVSSNDNQAYVVGVLSQCFFQNEQILTATRPIPRMLSASKGRLVRQIPPDLPPVNQVAWLVRESCNDWQNLGSNYLVAHNNTAQYDVYFKSITYKVYILVTDNSMAATETTGNLDRGRRIINYTIPERDLSANLGYIRGPNLPVMDWTGDH